MFIFGDGPPELDPPQPTQYRCDERLKTKTKESTMVRLRGKKKKREKETNFLKMVVSWGFCMASLWATLGTMASCGSGKDVAADPSW